MIYTCVIKSSGGYDLVLVEGHDWWVARKKLNLEKHDIIAMIPGRHASGLTFASDGTAVCPLDKINPSPLPDPNTHG